MLIGSFCTVLNQTILATAFPTLMKAFDISTATVQWLTTGFMMVNGIMIPVSAYLSNKRLYVLDAEFLKSAQIGKFAFIPRANGNLSFMKVVD